MVFAAGVAAAVETQGMSIQQFANMTGGALNPDTIEGLFGTGDLAGDMDSQWFGPEFENTSSASSFFSEFYIGSSLPIVGGFTPVKIDVSHKLPGKIYFGSGQEITYTQYQSSVASSARGNELWIQKGLDWSQYAIVPAGTGMQFIAFAPAAGQADYYEILQTDAQNITVKRISFYAGYNSINFLADRVGRHILLFVLNNQPSDAIIVDVISQAPTATVQPTAQPTASQMPPSTNVLNPYGQTGVVTSGYTQTTTNGFGQTTTSTSTHYQGYGTASTASPTQMVASGDTPVIIQSQGMRGYQVYLDEVLIGTEGTNGDPLDGKFSFSVVGNMNHAIRVFDGQFNYPKNMYFARGVTKIINVEPGTAVYV